MSKISADVKASELLAEKLKQSVVDAPPHHIAGAAAFLMASALLKMNAPIMVLAQTAAKMVTSAIIMLSQRPTKH